MYEKSETARVFGVASLKKFYIFSGESGEENIPLKTAHLRSIYF